MDFVKSLDLFGQNVTQIPCQTGRGAPTASTAGAVGCLYMDTNNGNVYKCISASNGVYTWVFVGEGTGIHIGNEAPTDDNVTVWIDTDEEPENPSAGNGGNDGATFVPSVSADGVISWTNDVGLDNPAPVNIKGKDGVGITNITITEV